MEEGLTTRRLFERIARDHPGTLPLGDLLDAFSERAFGLFLLLALLPAFLPLPAGAGAISGPLVSLAGLQLLAQAEHPWLPRWLQRRPVATASLDRLHELECSVLRLRTSTASTLSLTACCAGGGASAETKRRQRAVWATPASSAGTLTSGGAVAPP